MTKPLTRKEILWGSIYAGLEFFVLPVVIVLIGRIVPMPLWVMNFVLFVCNFVFSLLIFRRFLKANVIGLGETPLKIIGFAFLGLIFYFVGNMIVSIFIAFNFPDYVNLNNDAVSDMAMDGGFYMSLATVILAPVAEELLFRGVLFRGIYGKCKILAWIVSVLAFSAVHVVGYIGEYPPAMLAVAILQYLPAGLCLCFAYRLADNIFAPMIMHIFINLIAILAMGML